jgi:hypothetical protein
VGEGCRGAGSAQGSSSGTGRTGKSCFDCRTLLSTAHCPSAGASGAAHTR